VVPKALDFDVFGGVVDFATMKQTLPFLAAIPMTGSAQAGVAKAVETVRPSASRSHVHDLHR
jgi:hypothetical protein